MEVYKEEKRAAVSFSLLDASVKKRPCTITTVTANEDRPKETSSKDQMAATTELFPPYPPQNSLFVVNLQESIGKEYAPVIEDVFRMICVQFTIQLMLYFSGAAAGVFTLDLLCIMAYVIMGVLLYWLVFKSIVSFR